MQPPDRPRTPITALSALRWYLVNTGWWMRNGGWRQQGGHPIAFIDLRRNPWHRYLHILIIFLRMQGYAIRIRHRWGFLATWGSFDLFRRSGSGLQLTLSDHAGAADLFLTDDPDRTGGATVLDADYFGWPGRAMDGYAVPMPMADTVYLQGLHKRALPDARLPREHAIFFFGNMDRGSYGRPEPSAVFGCLSRMAALDLLRSRVPERVRDCRDLDEAQVTDGRDILLLDRAKRYIAPADLPDVLRRFDFFLGLSGVVMPLCHNLTEAMFAGCIPILQHPHLLQPALRDGEECIAFADAEGLITALERARSLTEEERIRMRSAVLRYYAEHLAPEAVVSRLTAQRGGRARLNGEQASTAILRARLQQAGITGAMPRPQR
ncbi:MAG: hypothetical protein QY325_00190 [Flavobacteriales bacterium]|jgi:hypothetical protein|nr:MAG: hypothetical protein QY325_00190 [Flavobacteriales bacterium]